ncbi:hypothetical protein L596_016824 [Steinernema carpocapsae]|uniref:Uncharacterized protein n=1 Tax=Steinernema carpocapsae TaxID=34508 RepID=A0A4U5NJ21_STECR|nr:hypothetical protein L596_016824 [Steinernema carpocapsae]
MDSVPIQFLEETFRLSTAFARPVNTWRHLSGFYSDVSTEVISKSVVVWLGISVSKDEDKIGYAFECRDEQGNTYSDLKEIRSVVKNFGRFKVAVKEAEYSGIPVDTNWDDPQLKQLLELSNCFPQVYYQNASTDLVRQVYDKLKHRKMRAPGDLQVFEWVNDEEYDSYDSRITNRLLCEQLGRGYLHTISLGAYDENVYRHQELGIVLDMFFRYPVHILNLNVDEGFEDYIRLIFKWFIIMQQGVNVEGKRMTIQNCGGLKDIEAWWIAQLLGVPCRVEKTLYTEKCCYGIGMREEPEKFWNQSMTHVQSGRGLRWISPTTAEFWFF